MSVGGSAILGIANRLGLDAEKPQIPGMENLMEQDEHCFKPAHLFDGDAETNEQESASTAPTSSNPAPNAPCAESEQVDGAQHSDTASDSNTAFSENDNAHFPVDNANFDSSDHAPFPADSAQFSSTMATSESELSAALNFMQQFTDQAKLNEQMLEMKSTMSCDQKMMTMRDSDLMMPGYSPWMRNAGRKKSHPVWEFFTDLRDTSFKIMEEIPRKPTFAHIETSILSLIVHLGGWKEIIATHGLDGVGGVVCMHCSWQGDDRSPNNLRTHLKKFHSHDGIFNRFSQKLAQMGSDSEVELMSPLPKKSNKNREGKSVSQIWTYFEKVGQTGKCMTCAKLLKLSSHSSTSSLWKHLHKMHPEIVVEPSPSGTPSLASDNRAVAYENSALERLCQYYPMEAVVKGESLALTAKLEPTGHVDDPEPCSADPDMVIDMPEVAADLLSLLKDIPPDPPGGRRKRHRPTKKSSEIWDHYRQLKEHQNVECEYCWKVLKRMDSSTKSMWGHMTAFHQDVLNDSRCTKKKKIAQYSGDAADTASEAATSAAKTPTQPYVKRSRGGGSSSQQNNNQVRNDVAQALQQLQQASSSQPGPSQMQSFLDNLPKSNEVINISAGYSGQDESKEQGGDNNEGLGSDASGSTADAEEAVAGAGGSPSVSSTNQFNALFMANPIMWNAFVNGTSVSTAGTNNNATTTTSSTSNAGSLGSAFTLNDGQCVSMLMKMALDLDLTMSYHKRRGDIELCFESNRTAEKSGGRGKVICLSDIGREIRVVERVNGAPTDTELWTKTDFNQFHWAIRGKCQKVLLKG